MPEEFCGCLVLALQTESELIESMTIISTTCQGGHPNVIDNDKRQLKIKVVNDVQRVFNSSQLPKGLRGASQLPCV
jgi:hypothetical protein